MWLAATFGAEDETVLLCASLTVTLTLTTKYQHCTAQHGTKWMTTLTRQHPSP
jgi:hypothetical protein